MPCLLRGEAGESEGEAGFQSGGCGLAKRSSIGRSPVLYVGGCRFDSDRFD